VNDDVCAVVLAAGSASRFGAVKVLAPYNGRPLLQHVLDAIAESGLDRVVVVLGDTAEAVEGAITWRTERRVRNPHPESGLASSLKVGLAAATAADSGTAAVLVALGDQPTLRPAVIRSLIVALRSAADDDRPVIVPRYAHDGATNPTLIARGAWHLIAEADGDRGLGPIVARSPHLVRVVPVSGANPDVDTPADLEALPR
jgi:molybdenum cofactor cytidylyltransferase